MKAINLNINFLKNKVFIFILLLLLFFGFGAKNVLAQDSASVLYVPLIGITAVPDPLTLPNGSGDVTYRYAVKNFLSEVALTEVQVVDDNCSPVRFITGDDNNNSKLDYIETWRYVCNTKLTRTTRSTATATGTANNIRAVHRAYATVIVDSKNPPPLVSISNTTKVAYPLSLSQDGGRITFTYRVNNPGLVALSDVVVTDDKCTPMSSKLGDTNGNNLLDINEVWIYTCTTNLTQTTVSKASVVAFANGLKAVGEATLNIQVDTPNTESPALFDVAISPLGIKGDLNIVVWEILSGVLMILIIFLTLTSRNKPRRAAVRYGSRRKR